MVFEYNSNHGTALLTDQILTTRSNTGGYLTAENLINLTAQELSPSNIIPINDLTDLQPYLNGGEYVIPPTKGFQFITNLVLNYPIRVPPAGVPWCIVGEYSPLTGYIQLIYTGSGAFIRGNTGSGAFMIDKLMLVQGSSTAKCFDLQNGSNPANWGTYGFLSNVLLIGWSEVGLVEGFNLGAVQTIGIIQCATGLTVRNWATIGFVMISWANGQNAVSSYVLKLEGYIGRFALTAPVAFVSQSNESLVYIDPSIISERLTISYTSPSGTGKLFHPSGLGHDNPKVLAIGNLPFPDSKIVASLTSTAEATTTIAVANTYYQAVLPAGGFTKRLAERIDIKESTVGSGIFNTIIYTALETNDIDVTIKCAIKVSTATPEGQLAIGKRGIAIDYTGFPLELATTYKIIEATSILQFQGVLTGTYSQSGTAVTVTFMNTVDGVNPIYVTGEKVYLDILTGTALDGLFIILSHSLTAITYTATTALTTLGTVEIHDNIDTRVKNIGSTANVLIRAINVAIIP